MKYLRLRAIALSGLVGALVSYQTLAEPAAFDTPLKVAMPIMDDDPDNGIEHPLVEYVRYWGETNKLDIEIQRLPFKRSIRHAESGLVDFHFPLLKSPDIDERVLPFDYSTTRITTVNFVTYTRDGEPLDLTRPEDFRIATLAGHAKLFPFLVNEEHSIEGSLMKLKSGRIDAYIFADAGADPALIEAGLTGIHRELYRTYDVHAVLPKGGKGGEIDQLLTRIMAGIVPAELPLAWQPQPYVDWQVHDDEIPRVVQK